MKIIPVILCDYRCQPKTLVSIHVRPIALTSTVSISCSAITNRQTKTVLIREKDSSLVMCTQIYPVIQPTELCSTLMHIQHHATSMTSSTQSKTIPYIYLYLTVCAVILSSRDSQCSSRSCSKPILQADVPVLVGPRHTWCCRPWAVACRASLFKSTSMWLIETH